MADNKTRATDADVSAHIAARASAQQAIDCDALITLFALISGEPARMWGPSIVGFGSYQYTYDSGRSGQAPLVGFAIRGRELCIYLYGEDINETLVTHLGKHRMGKACLYIKQLSDIDVVVLEQLVTHSVAAVRQRYGQS